MKAISKQDQKTIVLILASGILIIGAFIGSDIVMKRTLSVEGHNTNTVINEASSQQASQVNFASSQTSGCGI